MLSFDIISHIFSPQSDDVQNLLEATEELDNQYMTMYPELHAQPPPAPGAGKAKQGHHGHKNRRMNDYGGAPRY